MNLRDFALQTATDSELKTFSLVFTLMQVLVSKGILTEEEVDNISTVSAGVATNMIEQKKRKWEK